MTKACNIIVFISGRGSNFMALEQAAENYVIQAVISNKSEALGLKYAEERGIATYAFPRADYGSRAEQKVAMYQKCRELAPDYVALAGFMQILEAEFVEEFAGKIVNIHPSLLPEFPGLHTHERAIEAGVSKHGCSVHFVDSGLDTGPVIAQATCECLPDDTADSLAERLLPYEHKLYPWVLKGLAAGEISLNEQKVCYSDNIRAEAAVMGFALTNEENT